MALYGYVMNIRMLCRNLLALAPLALHHNYSLVQLFYDLSRWRKPSKSTEKKWHPELIFEHKSGFHYSFHFIICNDSPESRENIFRLIQELQFVISLLHELRFINNPFLWSFSGSCTAMRRSRSMWVWRHTLTSWDVRSLSCLLRSTRNRK